VIAVEDLTKDYNLGKTVVRALRGVSLTIDHGEFICISGPSGCGKTTLLNLIGCLDRPTSGKVEIDGEDVGRLDRNRLAEIRNRKIGFIFQTFNLIPVLNAYENIELPLTSWRHLSGKQKRDKIMVLMDEVGLKDFSEHKPGELSGGQMQRVSIARALVTDPQVVLADEPTANLDSETSERILQVMLQLNKIHKTTFVFSTHDPVVSRYARRNIRLLDGVIKGETP
jgi:putative ABC transport system ATP-binding protein